VDVILVPEQNIESGVIQLGFWKGSGPGNGQERRAQVVHGPFILKNVRLRPAAPVDSLKLTEDLKLAQW